MNFKELKEQAKILYQYSKVHYQQKKVERTKFIKALDTKTYDFQLATWFGSGLIIPAPGTWGTVGGLIFGFILWFLTNGFFVFLASIILFFMGLKAVERIERKLNAHDPSFIVIDEVSAILLILSYNILVINWLASFNITHGVSTIITITTFSLFRYFDAKKPGYIGTVDKDFKGAWGVMLDDTVAALYAIFASIGLFVSLYFLSIFAM